MRTRLARTTLSALSVLATAIAVTPVVASPASAGDPVPGVNRTSTSQSPSRLASGWQPRPEQYAGTVTRTDLPIRMSDGVVLRGDLTLPADATGRPTGRRVPVVVTITAYNKTALGNGAGATLAGADPAYLVKRGYAQLTVDARGTGSSEGTWGAFSPRENKDAGEIVDYAHRAKWSNGKVAMTGASYMGISQLFAAADHPAGLKAIFPQVPAGDVYRDVVASGGQIDAGFIPLWLGLVTGAGLVPPAYGAQDPESGFQVLMDRLMTATTFTAPLLADAVLGQDPAYDGKFYRDRSPLEVIDKVDVPTFLISGEYDLFQRGTPLDFEALQDRGVPTRLIIGPWDHLQGSSGAEVGKAGYGSLAELQLRWFDHYVKGRPDPALLKDIKPLTYYEQGTDRWRTAHRWVGRDLEARSYRLSGSATMGGGDGVLTRGTPNRGESTLLPVPVSGLCTRSANQWTAGIMNQVWADNPCLQDNQLNDHTGLAFESAPVERTLHLQGPINARLYTSTPAGDGMLSVSVEDVAPDGSVTRLTGGWQVISQRALDHERSRYLDGKLIQPYHPFTKASKKSLDSGEVAPIDVEVFPTGAAIRPGHRLRLAIQAYDTPHLLAPLPDLPATLVPMTIHTSERHPSVVTLPVR